MPKTAKNAKPTSQNVAFPNLPTFETCQKQQKLKTYIPKRCLSKSSNIRNMPKTAKTQNLHPKTLPFQIFQHSRHAKNSKSSKPTSQHVAFPNLPTFKTCQKQQKLKTYIPKRCLSHGFIAAEAAYSVQSFNQDTIILSFDWLRGGLVLWWLVRALARLKPRAWLANVPLQPARPSRQKLEGMTVQDLKDRKFRLSWPQLLHGQLLHRSTECPWDQVLTYSHIVLGFKIITRFFEVPLDTFKLRRILDKTGHPGCEAARSSEGLWQLPSRDVAQQALIGLSRWEFPQIVCP